jgi:hypothetical protein
MIQDQPVAWPPGLQFKKFVARSLVEKLLSKVPARRGDTNQVMNHPWLKSSHWKDYKMKRITAPFKPDVAGDLDEVIDMPLAEFIDQFEDQI